MLSDMLLDLSSRVSISAPSAVEVVCLAPPLVTSAEQVDRMVEILHEAIPAALQGV